MCYKLELYIFIYKHEFKNSPALIKEFPTKENIMAFFYVKEE